MYLGSTVYTGLALYAVPLQEALQCYDFILKLTFLSTKNFLKLFCKVEM